MATKAKRTNTLLMIAFAVILLVVIFVAYAYGHRVDFEKGNKEGLTTETNLQEKNLIVDEGKLNKCLEEADATYISRWNNMCKRLGLSETVEGDKKECGIPQDAAIHYDNEHNKDKEFCLKLYKN